MIGIIIHNKIKKPVRNVAIICTISTITLITTVPQQLVLKRVKVAFVPYCVINWGMWWSKIWTLGVIDI